ncbi:MAG: hypothetical protein FWG08_05690 [Propionibacteriaceae bacterium]|nr:hypothetical protein [Propionibacteriaceae bacterium]
MARKLLTIANEGADISIGWVLTSMAIGLVALAVIPFFLLGDRGNGTDQFVTVVIIAGLVAAVGFTVSYYLFMLRAKYKRTAAVQPVAPPEQAQGYGWSKASELGRSDRDPAQD